jgi:hypothetical protein
VTIRGPTNVTESVWNPSFIISKSIRIAELSELHDGNIGKIARNGGANLSRIAGNVN